MIESSIVPSRHNGLHGENHRRLLLLNTRPRNFKPCIICSQEALYLKFCFTVFQKLNSLSSVIMIQCACCKSIKAFSFSNLVSSEAWWITKSVNAPWLSLHWLLSMPCYAYCKHLNRYSIVSFKFLYGSVQTLFLPDQL